MDSQPLEHQGSPWTTVTLIIKWGWGSKSRGLWTLILRNLHPPTFTTSNRQQLHFFVWGLPVAIEVTFVCLCGRTEMPGNEHHLEGTPPIILESWCTNTPILLPSGKRTLNYVFYAISSEFPRKIKFHSINMVIYSIMHPLFTAFPSLYHFPKPPPDITRRNYLYHNPWYWQRRK